MRDLLLTSPVMTGADVRKAQKTLAARDFHPGPQDGQYGPTTAAATHRAKYWLGYKTSAINSVYGPALDAQLRGAAKLSVAQKARVKLRRGLNSDKKKRLKMLAVAQTQIGVKESPPDSNLQPYGKWYGFNGVAWCVIFQSWCAAKAGIPFKQSYVPTVIAMAQAGANGLHVVGAAGAEPGDWACYGFGGSIGVHIGVLDTKPVAGRFKAVEGNTALGNDSDGGEVMLRDRTTSDVIAFVRWGM